MDDLALLASAIRTAATIAVTARELADLYPTGHYRRFAARTACRAAELDALLDEAIAAEVDADLAALPE